MSKYVIFFLINAAIIFGLWWFFPRTEVVEVFEQAEIDENVWVRRATVASDRAIINDLRQDNENLAAALDRQNDRVASLTRIVGELNVERDALADSLQSISLDVQDSIVTDTTFTFQQYFGSHLFRVTNTTSIKDNVFTSHLTLFQVRDIKLDVVTTISEDEGIVMVYVSSDDFVRLEYTSQTALRQKRWRWYHYAAAGFIVGSTTALLLN